VATLHHSISKLNISQKEVSKQAAEQDEYLRAIWEGEMAQYDDPDLFVFLDESSVNNKTGQQNKGRSHKGAPCVRQATFIRGIQYSILPAPTMEGIMAMDISPAQ
jgi:hypothetical protein